jgi:tight adherence protein B
MGWIVGLVFVGVFAVVALPMFAMGSEASQQAKQVRARLASAVANGNEGLRSQILDLRKAELLSAIPWINRRLLKFEMAPRLSILLDQADIDWTAGRLLTTCGLCFGAPAYAIYVFYASISVSLLVGGLLGSAPFAYVLLKRRKRFDQFMQGLPEALDLMVSAIRAGHSLNAAMGLVGRECPNPVGGEFKTTFEQQNYGLELKAAMNNLVSRVPLQELKIVSTAIMIQKESGGNLAEVLDKTSHVIRERFRLKRQVGVYTAQGRLTGWILTLLPVGLGIVLYIANPEMMSVLWINPLGVKLLWTSTGMLLAGGLIIRKIVNIDI